MSSASSRPSLSTPDSTDPEPYPEIAEQAQRMADECEDTPTLPEVPSLPDVPSFPAPAAPDREGVLVRVSIALACLFFVVLCVAAVICYHR